LDFKDGGFIAVMKAQREEVVLKRLVSMNAFILGGGISTRMKVDKAFLEFQGKRLIDITISATAGLFGRVYLVGRDYAHPLLAGSFEDAVKGIGPLGGIYSALQKTDTDYNFFTGVDYPFIDERLILILLSLLKQKGSEYEGIIPVAPDGPHPLFAFYRKSCLPSVERCIKEEDYRIRAIAVYSRIYFSQLSKDLETVDYEKPTLDSLKTDEDRNMLVRRALVNINNYEDYLRLND
jgi:molybdopterin-guanine dinucleotide biosynthesis protein A